LILLNKYICKKGSTLIGAPFCVDKLVFIGAFDLNRKCAIPENKVGEGLAPPEKRYEKNLL